ncbi:unnamed protein product [Moneuplotes crassus]|uniref:Uncharacterized protein n=1 Tax=Euplotes crassus TaxID=5936 RepID=A0AAD1Y721_EUPCR|nr:unnamed protein product [Moneuplotes crassus]
MPPFNFVGGVQTPGVTSKTSAVNTDLTSAETLNSMKRKVSFVPKKITSLSPRSLKRMMKKKQKSSFNESSTKDDTTFEDKLYYYYNTYNEDFGFDKHMIFDSLRVLRQANQDSPSKKAKKSHTNERPKKNHQAQSPEIDTIKKNTDNSDLNNIFETKKAKINEWTRIADFILSPNNQFFKEFVECVKKFQPYGEVLKKKRDCKVRNKSLIRKLRRGSKNSRRISISQHSTGNMNHSFLKMMNTNKEGFRPSMFSKFKDDSSVKSISSCDTPTRLIEKSQYYPKILRQMNKKKSIVKRLSELQIHQTGFLKTARKAMSPRIQLKKLSRDPSPFQRLQTKISKNADLYSSYSHRRKFISKDHIEENDSEPSKEPVQEKVKHKDISKPNDGLRKQDIIRRIKPSLLLEYKHSPKLTNGQSGRMKKELAGSPNKLIADHSARCLAISPTPSYQRKALNLNAYIGVHSKSFANFVKSPSKKTPRASSKHLKTPKMKESDEERLIEISPLQSSDLKSIEKEVKNSERLKQLITSRPRCFLQRINNNNFHHYRSGAHSPEPKTRTSRKKFAAYELI